MPDNEEIKLEPEQLSALEEITKAQEMSDAAKMAVKQALAALNKVKADLPADMFAKVTQALANLVGYGYAYPEKTQKAADSETTKLIKDALAKLKGEKPEINAALEILAKAIGEKITKSEEVPEQTKAELEALYKAREDQAKEIEELKRSIAQKEDEALTKVYLEKAAGFKHVPAATEELAVIMKHVAATSKEDGEKLERVLKAVDGAMAESGLFVEQGSSAVSNDKLSENDARAETMAKELVEKSEGKLTKEQALAKVYKSNPELAAV